MANIFHYLGLCPEGFVFC